jgi:pyruvate formate lyase activating enzyme
MMNKYKVSENRLSIMEIERFAVHDIRTVVFLQGCPLHCSWCSNPESQKRKPHLLHIKNKCIGCGRCEAICTRGNISIQDHYPIFNRQACVACKACERICPQNAIKFVGESITSSEVMEILLRDRDYYLNSGGGVTFSGGEAFTQFEGLMDLLIQCKNEKLHTSVETCGQVNLDKIKQALPLIDLFLFDIKHTDKDLLQKETGANLDTILTNLRYISSKSANKVTIRVPVIPGFNFNENTLREIFMLAKENRIKCVHLLPYHTLGKDKYEQLGLTYPYPCEQMLAKEELFPFKEMGEKMGLEIRIGG